MSFLSTLGSSVKSNGNVGLELTSPLVNVPLLTSTVDASFGSMNVAPGTYFVEIVVKPANSITFSRMELVLLEGGSPLLESTVISTSTATGTTNTYRACTVFSTTVSRVITGTVNGTFASGSPLLNGGLFAVKLV